MNSPLILSFLIVLAGFLVRIRDVYYWFKHPEIYMHEGIPLIQNYDGFFFARLIRDGFSFQDTLRNFPEGAEYVFPPMMVSLGHFIYRITGFPVEWTWTFLDAFLPSLAGVPLFLFLRALGYSVAGFVAGFTLVISPPYLLRTGINYIDTDSLNLFFLLLNAPLFLWFEKSSKKLIPLALLSLNNFLFFWWYAHFEFIFLAYAGMFAYTLLSKKWSMSLMTFVSFLVVFFFSNLLSGNSLLASTVWRLVVYFGGGFSRGYYPTVGATIGELQRMSFENVYDYFFTSEYLFYTALIGIFLSALYIRLRYLLLLTFVVLFILTFLKGYVRLYMYSAVLVYLGFAFFLELSYRLLLRIPMENFRFMPKVYLSGLFLLSLPGHQLIFKKPMFTTEPEVYELFRKLRELTPENAPILSWWDYGYAIQYYARRATYHDGGSQGGIKTNLIARALMTKSEEEALSLIALVSDRHKIMSAQCLVDRGMSFWDILSTIKGDRGVFKREEVYLLISMDMIGKVRSMMFLGYAVKNAKSAVLLYECQAGNCTHRIDSQRGLLLLREEGKDLNFNMSRYVEVEEGRVQKDIYFREVPSGSVIASIKSRNKVYIYHIPPDMQDRLIYRLYFFGPSENSAFELVYDYFPYGKLYRIRYE